MCPSPPPHIGHGIGTDEVSTDQARLWTEFTDPDDASQRIRADLTWLTSSWRCLFGQGCPGVYAERPDDGCCTLGAHFSDADDIARVQAVVADLGEDEWQMFDHGQDLGWQRREQSPEDGGGEEVATSLIDGACIFLNQPGFPAGAGCALHQHALAQGAQPLTTKPDVCWQLPIRRTYRNVTRPDDTSYTEVTITEYERGDWGPGGHDFDWYCTASPAAHTAAEPVYISLAAELTELTGAAAYAQLRELCEEVRPSSGRSNEGRPLLPIFVHPATAPTLAHD